MRTLSTDRIRDWQQQAERARLVKESRRARQPRPARELVAAALAPLGIRRVPQAPPLAGRTGGAEGQPATADECRPAGSPVA